MQISKTKLETLIKLIEKGNERAFYDWPEWTKIREKVLALDHYECTRCKEQGKYTPAILVHHVNHLKDRPELALSIWTPGGDRQLISLCRACHELEHPERLRSPWSASDKPQLTTERWD